MMPESDVGGGREEGTEKAGDRREGGRRRK